MAVLDIRKGELWELLYADDLGILAETEYECQRKLVEWQEAFERKGSQSKWKENRSHGMHTRS